MNAVRYATSLAQEADAHLTLLHVMEYDPREVPELYDTLVADARLTIAESRELSQAISRERLDTALSDEARTHCTVDTIVLFGKELARDCPDALNWRFSRWARDADQAHPSHDS